jgi:hypothetical protein
MLDHAGDSSEVEGILLALVHGALERRRCVGEFLEKSGNAWVAASGATIQLTLNEALSQGLNAPQLEATVAKQLAPSVEVNVS